MGMQNLRSTQCQRLRVFVTEIVQELCLRGLIGVRGVDSIDVRPNHKLVRINHVRDDCAGKVGAVAAERRDASVWRGSDEASDYRHDTVCKQGKQNLASLLPGLFQMRLGIAKCIASQYKFRGRNGNRGNAGVFEGGGE